MRGTLGTFARNGVYKRIIPAYAGNTRKTDVKNLIKRDHPRVCGEHLRKACFRGGLTGSSPRMRGTLAIVSYYDGDMGIIPAYAGNTRPI